MGTGLYESSVTALGKIKVYPYPMFVIYQPKGYAIKGPEKRVIESLLKPGDYLIRGFYNYLDGILIPGYFSHAGFYYGENRVIHAVAEGVLNEDISDFCSCDYLSILRDEAAAQDEIRAACERSLTFVGDGYNFDFTKKIKKKHPRFYCTQLVVNVWQNKIQLVPQDVNFLWIKRNIYLPDQFYKCAKLTNIYNSQEVDSKKIKVG
jgi:hypothetical protein